VIRKVSRKAVKMTVTVQDEYFTLDEVAEKLKVSKRSVARWVEKGTLPVIRLSAQAGSVRVAESDLKKFLDERRTQPRTQED
jgi:excisionase family DNA binding protein